MQKKLVNELSANDYSSCLENLSLPLIYSLEMEDSLNKQQLRINYSKEDLNKIEETILNLQGYLRISYCYMMLKSFANFEDQNLEDSRMFQENFGSLHQKSQKLNYEEFQFVQRLVNYIQISMKEENIHNNEQIFMSTISNDLLLIYLIYFIKYYRQYVEFLDNQILKDFDYGKDLCSFHSQQQQNALSENVLRVKYDFCKISLSYFFHLKNEERLFTVYHIFMDYFYCKIELQSKLLFIEQTNKVNFLDFFIFYLEDSQVGDVYKQIKSLTEQQDYNQYLFDLNCLVCSWIISKLKNCKSIISDFFYSIMQKWWIYLPQLIISNPQRISKILARIMNNEEQEWLQQWQQEILKIIQQMLFRGNALEQDRYKQILIFTFLLLRKLKKHNEQFFKEIFVSIPYQQIRDLEIKNLVYSVMTKQKELILLPTQQSSFFAPNLFKINISKTLEFFIDSQKMNPSFLKHIFQNFLIDLRTNKQLTPSFVFKEDLTLFNELLQIMKQQVNQSHRQQMNKQEKQFIIFIYIQILEFVLSVIQDEEYSQILELSFEQFISISVTNENWKCEENCCLIQKILLQYDSLNYFLDLDNNYKILSLILIILVSAYDSMVKFIKQKPTQFFIRKIGKMIQPIFITIFQNKKVIGDEKIQYLLKILSLKDSTSLISQSSLKPLGNFSCILLTEIQSVILRAVFESELETQFKLQVLDDIALVLETRQGQHECVDTLNNQLIILLAIQENCTEEQKKVSEKMIEIIKKACEWSFQQDQFLNLLRLVLGENHQSLIFEQKNDQTKTRPCLYLLQNQQSILLELQFKYNYHRVLQQFIEIFQHILNFSKKQQEKQHQAYISFVDATSTISLPTNLPFGNNFTIYFEVEFQESTAVNGLIVDNRLYSTIPYRHLYQEIFTFYGKQTIDEQSGFQILILKSKVKIRWFNLSKASKEIEELIFETQIYKKQEIYTFQISFQNLEIRTFVNNEICKIEKQKFRLNQIQNIVKIDIGKSIHYSQSISTIFGEHNIEYEDLQFQGKLLNFWVSHQQISKPVSHLANINQQTLLDFSDQKELKALSSKNILNEMIKTNQVVKMISNNITEIFVQNKVHISLILIIHEAIQVQNCPEITRLIDLLLNEVVFLDLQILDDFFRNFNYFQIILTSISQIQDLSFVYLFNGFLDKLHKMGKKGNRYYLFFYKNVFTNFQYFEKWLISQDMLRTQDNINLFVREGLQVPSKTLEELVLIYLKNAQNKLITEWEIYQKAILEYFSIKYQQSTEDIIAKSLSNDLTILAQFFSIQKLTSNIYYTMITIFHSIQQNHSKQLQKFFSKYSQGVLQQKQEFERLALNQLLQQMYIKSFEKTDDSEINLNFIHFLLFMEDINQNFNKSEKYQINQYLLAITEVKPNLSIKQNEKQNEIEQIQRFIERISNTNVLCSYINIINCYLSFSQDKLLIIEIICKKIFLSNQLYEIQNQSEIENILHKYSLHKNLYEYAKMIFRQTIKNRFIYSELSKQSQKLLLNIITTDQEGFFVIFQEVLELLVKGYGKSNPLILINIIKFLWLIEFDCFREKDTYDQDIAEKLLIIIEILHQLQLFSFVEKWPRNENNKNQNSPQYGGLFRIFTNILLQAADRNKHQIVIDCTIKLLEVFYETIKQNQTNSRLVNDVYGFFNLKQDSKGISFPILPYLFEANFKPQKEHLEKKMEKLQFLIGKSKFETETYFNNQKKPLKDEMMSEFEIGNSHSQKKKDLLNQESKQNQTVANYITTFEKGISSINYSTSMISTSTTFFADKSYFTDDCSLKISENAIQEFALNFYFNYNLWDQEKTFFELINDQDKNQKNGGQFFLVQEYPWVQSNKQNFENTIYFSKKQYVLPNYQNNFQAVIGKSFKQSINFENLLKFDQRMNHKSIIQISAKIKDIDDNLRCLNIYVQEAIELDDPFSNERIDLNPSDTHVTIVKHQQVEMAVLIRNQRLDFQHLFFIIFAQQEDLQLFLKCCKEKNIQCSKQITNDLKKILVERWCQGKLSNYQYIFLLNYYSGRNILDKNNYYIYPWTTIQFNESSLQIDRNLSQSIFSIQSKNKKNVFPYYSNAKQIQYFFRPKTLCLLEFLEGLQEKGEAIPELYSNYQIFEKFQFPPWVQTKTPEEFIYIMRMQLESIKMQNQLHNWIDLTFGVYSTSQSNTERNLRLHPSAFQEFSTNYTINHQISHNKCEYGQSSRQIFTDQHVQRKINIDYFETQTMQNLNYKKLLFEGINSKIISIYYFIYKAIFVIYENGQAAVFKIQERSFLQMMTLQDLMSPSKTKKLETTQLLKQQQICFVDMENQHFSDNQESQYHIVENNAKFSLSLSNPAIGFFITGYSEGEFRLFEGLNMKETIFQTPEKAQITCISINHYRKILVIGQQNSKITLWNITKNLELNPEPYLIIKSHQAAISIISVSASKILSISKNNVVQIHLYDGKLIQAFQLDTYETIKFCQISYTMNLYIFLDCENNLTAYNDQGNQYLLPIEFVQDIKTIIPITPFCSQFLYLTSGALYFDDIFLLKMKQEGIILEKEQEKKNYNIEFQALKYMRGEKLLLPDFSEKTLLQSCIVINVQSNLRCFKFLLIGTEDGKLWQVSDENDAIQYFKQKFERSGITN